MNKNFFVALKKLEKERKLPENYLLEKIQAALVLAVKKDYEVEDENVRVEIDPETETFNVFLLKEVVEEVYDPNIEVTLPQARLKQRDAYLGDFIPYPLNTKDFGRIAAQTAKHVIRQGLKEAERSQQYAEMQSRAH